MSKNEIFISLLFISLLNNTIYSQIIPEPLNIDDDLYINATSEGKYFKLSLDKSKTSSNTQYLAISTTPDEYHKPAFIYLAYENSKFVSPDYRNFSSQEIGKNILYIKAKTFLFTEEINSFNIFIYSLEETKVRLQVFVGEHILLQEYPKGFRHSVNLSILSDKDNIDNFGAHFEINKAFNKTKKLLIYGLAESINLFNFTVQLVDDMKQIKKYQEKKVFENGYGAIVEIPTGIFDGDNNPRIRVDVSTIIDNYFKSKIDVGYEIIDNNDDLREVNILEHVYGMAEVETCYKVKDLKNKPATMLINAFNQGILFNIKDNKNSIVYSLDIFNNYYIRLPKEFYNKDNYFCFKHITPKESEEEIYGEISYNFQIYYEEELSKYQIFIIPLISGKIYTHSLNRGDIMIYRNKFYSDLTKQDEIKIYSANMLRIRGNPKLYGFICVDYPNCKVNSPDLKDPLKVEEIFPLNMYHINKRLKAEGNTDISPNGEDVYELRQQYMTIVSCESDSKDPNNGECKFNIEINNEGEEIQLIPDTIFATSIINLNNYFMIRLKDTKATYLKLYFTVLTGNAELYIYEDLTYTKELLNYKLSHIHRKEIIEINEIILDNYYIKIKCSEPAFIQLKYETNENYKGYDNLLPNEVNIVPINKYIKSYYNLYNPNYYYPLNNEERNNDFYYRINTIDCFMNYEKVDMLINNLTEYNFEQQKNILYSYLSTYGFISQIDKFIHTSSENEKCGLIIYNGEKSEKRPLLITSDIPHQSTFEDTHYIYPIIYNGDKDEGIIIEFKIYDNEETTLKYLYRLTYGTNSKQLNCYISDDSFIYINPDFYYSDRNIMSNLYISFHKINSYDKYYITTNIISSKISPEYLSSNQTYNFHLRPSSSKYFYSSINEKSEGYVKFKNLPNKIRIYAKIIEKNKVEKDHNWNGRVKLPDVNDTELLNVGDGLIEYDKIITDSCLAGCELYFHVKSIENKKSQILTQDDLIPISFTIKEEVYKGDDEEENEEEKEQENEEEKEKEEEKESEKEKEKKKEKEIEDKGENDKGNENGSNNTWIIIVIVVIVIIISAIAGFLMWRKTRQYNFIDNIDNETIGELGDSFQ